MYPDLRDVAEQMCHLKGVPRPTPDEFINRTFVMVRLVKELLGIMYSWCRNHGRHRFVHASEIKRMAETFLGPISDYEFCLALLPGGSDGRRRPSNLPINVRKFEDLELKFPPLHKFDDAVTRERWAEIRSGLEAEFEASVVQVNEAVRIVSGEQPGK